MLLHPWLPQEDFRTTRDARGHPGRPEAFGGAPKRPGPPETPLDTPRPGPESSSARAALLRSARSSCRDFRKSVGGRRRRRALCDVTELAPPPAFIVSWLGRRIATDVCKKRSRQGPSAYGLAGSSGQWLEAAAAVLSGEEGVQGRGGRDGGGGRIDGADCTGGGMWGGSRGPNPAAESDGISRQFNVWLVCVCLWKSPPAVVCLFV